MSTYLLDTNAVQSIGRRVLINCREHGHRLAVSTISCFELVTHLDDDNFRLARGNARKALLCEILHDPLAEIMLDVGCQAGVHAGRLDDQPGLLAILNELEQCETYEALRLREAELAGQRRPIDDIARNLRNAFDEDRVRFVERMRIRCRAYVTRYGRDGAIHLEGESFCCEAIGLADTLHEHTSNSGCDTTRNALADRTVLGCGYGVARAGVYIDSVGDGQEVVIDGNDYEDYLISLHLGVGNDRIFVTNDRGVRIALGRTVAAFEQYFATRGAAFAHNVSIITPAEFISLFG